MPISRKSASPSRPSLRSAKATGKRPLLSAPRLFEELRTIENRVSLIAAFIPFLGPFFIKWREVKTLREKQELKAICFAVTALAVSSLVIALELRPGTDEGRVVTDIRALGRIIQQFRVKNGVYPDVGAWGHSLGVDDPHYLDPWGRPYIYSLRNGRAIVGTYGRDAQEGGSGDDADVWLSFKPPQEKP